MKVGNVWKSQGSMWIGISFQNSLGLLAQAHTMLFSFEATTSECQASASKHALAIAMANDFKRVILNY
jgi:NAD(P)H-nitrite reductase large subunit